MIWFTCKKCGKTHGRGENSAGTMIFCACGHGNTVPWESTTAEPVAPPPVAAAPRVPDLAPIQFDPVTINGPPSSAAPSKASSYPVDPSRVEDEERPYRRGRAEKRDPDYCFNHQRRPKVAACAECEEGFCQDCLVKFQGVLLCGPCKNFRSRRLELPPATSTVASASLIMSLVAGPPFMCLFMASPGNPAMQVLSYLSLLPQLLAFGLGLWALRDAERESKGGGQWVAVTGMTAAALTCLMMVLMNVFANRLA
jgi:hypothetical protein